MKISGRLRGACHFHFKDGRISQARKQDEAGSKESSAVHRLDFIDNI
jgi:hypothetical protein